MPVATDVSVIALGFVIAIDMPSPTRCAELDEGVSAEPGLALPGEFLSDVQYLTRCTELSKLLRKVD